VKIAYIAAGAAGRYCGNCLRDHALAVALRESGEDVILVPTYTPLRTDLEPNTGGLNTGTRGPLFFNGAGVWLAGQFESFRRPRPLLRRLLNSTPVRWLLGNLPARAEAAKLGALTVSMLEGEEGHHRGELDELAGWLSGEVRPDLVHITNALLLGMARRLKAATGAPVVVSLQSEDIFLDALEEPHRERCLSLIRERGAEVDSFIAVSTFYAGYAERVLGLPREKIHVVLSGVPLDGHGPPAARDGLTIGYLARMGPEKGLHLLCRAFRDLAREPGLENLRLRAAGYLGPAEIPFVARLRRELAWAGLRRRVEFLGTVDRETKLEFLRNVDVLAVPTVYKEPKGLFVLEALASGVPVVVPRHGALPELIELTDGGLLHEPEDIEDLKRALRALLLDPELRRSFSESGREAVHARFSSKRMARDTLEVYRRLVPSPASA
jgi:glycosyltransferase involved in cell wall biosynthesis